MLAKPQGFPRKLGGCAGLDPRLRSAVSAGVGDGERGLRRGLRAPGVGVRPKWVLEYSPSNKRIRYFVSITYVRTGLWTAHKFCGGGIFLNRQRTRSITTVPWNLAGTALIVSALSLFGASGLSAQSRAEELRQRREAKSSTLDAPSRGGLENGLYKFENQRLLERLAKGYKSFHPKLGGLATGSGFALGVEYLSDELAEEGVVFRIAGQASPVGYQRYELQLALPELFDNHFLFDFTARHRNYPQEDFLPPPQNLWAVQRPVRT